MTEIPSGLVGAFVLAPDCALQLDGTHAFLGFAKQQCQRETSLATEVGVMEDRSSGDGELIFTVLAIEQLNRGRKADNPTGLASRTFRAIRPAQPLQQIATFIIGKNNSVRSGRVIVHTPSELEKKEALRKVPMRKLVASIKRDIRKQLSASRPAAKPKKK